MTVRLSRDYTGIPVSAVLNIRESCNFWGLKDHAKMIELRRLAQGNTLE